MRACLLRDPARRLISPCHGASCQRGSIRRGPSGPKVSLPKARRAAALAVAFAGMCVGIPIMAQAAFATGAQATRFDDVRARLESEGYFALDDAGQPLRDEVDLTLVYERGHKREIGGSEEGVNLYITRGAVAVPYSPAAVIEVLTGFDDYDTWAMDGLNDVRLHPDYPETQSWNFDILGISAAPKPGIVFDLEVLKFGRGSITLTERERVYGGDDGPSVIHLTLGGNNLFVKHFTFTFFIFPLPDGRGSAIHFENETGLRSVVDWFFRRAADDPVSSTKPRVGRFLENLIAELARRNPKRTGSF